MTSPDRIDYRGFTIEFDWMDGGWNVFRPGEAENYANVLTIERAKRIVDQIITTEENAK